MKITIFNNQNLSFWLKLHYIEYNMAKRDWQGHIDYKSEFINITTCKDEKFHSTIWWHHKNQQRRDPGAGWLGLFILGSMVSH